MIGRMMIAASALAIAMPALAQSDAAQRFGARPAASTPSLSPDGKKVAFLRAAKGAGTLLYVADLATGETGKAILSSSGRPERLTECQWLTDTRLVCEIYVIEKTAYGLSGFTRLLALNADGSGLTRLTQRAGSNAMGAVYDGGSVIDWSGGGTGGSVLMTRQFVPETTTGSLVASERRGLGVERVDTTTLAARTVVPPRATATEYISDGHGTVRVMGLIATNDAGYSGNRLTYLYRLPDTLDWKPLSSLTLGGVSRGFDPYAVDHDLNAAYGFDSLDGRRALFRVALDGSLKRDVVVARPDVDVDGLLTIGRQHRVVGASYATDRRTAIFFDPELAALGGSLHKALPGSPIISFVDADAREDRLLLFAGSDNDPGRYYIYDKPGHKLSPLLAVRPDLADVRLATVKAITFKAADGTDIPAYLTLPPGSDGKGLPAIVMPHGGPGARDEWGFDWLSQYYANRGFAVLQPNFRGSTGYGEKWFQKNGFQSWRVAIGDVDDGGRYLLSSGIAAPGKLAIVGWSYGGYAALQSAVLDPDLFKAIVAVAPVTDLSTLVEASRRFANFHLVDSFVGHGPHVTQGSPAQNVAAFKAPVLIFHGDLDQNVGVEESRLMAARLKRADKAVDYVEFKGLDHYLDDDTVRAELLARSDAFLRKALKL